MQNEIKKDNTSTYALVMVIALVLGVLVILAKLFIGF